MTATAYDDTLNVGVGWRRRRIPARLRSVAARRKIDDDVAARVGAAVIDVLSLAMLEPGSVA